MHPEPRSGCPINAPLEVLGAAWALLALRDVIWGNRRHFREVLAKSVEGIASRILAGRLKRLVDPSGPLAFNAMGLQHVDSFGGARLGGVCGGLGPHLANIGIGLVVGVDGVRPPLGG
jgi:hypothetical protein